MGKLDLTGHTYNRLTVLRETAPAVKPSKWVCQCECGNIKAVTGAQMRNGTIKSCGCLHIETNKALFTKHGEIGTKLYAVHQAMLRRCTTKSHKHYSLYGGRGIQVCDQWLDYPTFKQWAEDSGYREGLSLDRINNDGNYTPENCRWTDQTIQSRNRNAQPGRSSKFIGVTWDTERAKWFSSIGIAGKTVALGRFADEEAAARTRDNYIITNNLEGFTLNFK